MPFTSNLPISYSSKISLHALLWHLFKAIRSSRLTPRKPVSIYKQKKYEKKRKSDYISIQSFKAVWGTNMNVQNGTIPSLSCEALTRNPLVISFIRCKSRSICGNVSTNAANWVNETAFDFSFNSVITTWAVSNVCWILNIGNHFIASLNGIALKTKIHRQSTMQALCCIAEPTK